MCVSGNVKLGSKGERSLKKYAKNIIGISEKILVYLFFYDFSLYYTASFIKADLYQKEHIVIRLLLDSLKYGRGH